MIGNITKAYKQIQKFHMFSRSIFFLKIYTFYLTFHCSSRNFECCSLILFVLETFILLKLKGTLNKNRNPQFILLVISPVFLSGLKISDIVHFLLIDMIWITFLMWTVFFFYIQGTYKNKHEILACKMDTLFIR